MKKMNKIIIGLFTFVILATMFNINSVMASNGPPVNVPGNNVQMQVQANNSVTFAFQQQTQLKLNSNVNVQLRINCDSENIQGKDFELEIEAEGDLQMNMTCTEEQAELGLLKGNRSQVRNRNRHMYQEGFCVQLQCNNSNQMQAKLKIKATNQNRNGTWAYYAGDTEEWVPVQTSEQNGYLVCNTNHFSTWTILLPESEESEESIPGFIGIGVGLLVGIIAAISVMYKKNRK